MILNPQIQLKNPNIQSKIDITSLQAGGGGYRMGM